MPLDRVGARDRRRGAGGRPRPEGCGRGGSRHRAHGCGAGGSTGCARSALAAVQRAQERAHLEPRVEVPQRLGVRRPRPQRRLVDRGRSRSQRIVASWRDSSSVSSAGAQVLAHLARDLGRVRQDRVERAVLREPLGRGLRPHLVDAGDVVRAVTDQRQVVDDLLGLDVELRLDAVAVEQRVRHRVDERDALVDELRHVLVAGRDQHLLAGRGRARGQRADDVVGLDARDAQQRQAQRR